MVESHNYQQTQHAVCLLMINAPDQCGLLQRCRVMEDSCEVFFPPSSPCFLLFSLCYQPNWMISGGILPLSGVLLSFVDFAFRFEIHSNYLSPLSFLFLSFFFFN